MTDETVNLENPEEPEEIIPFLSRTEIVLQEVLESGDFELGFGFINDLREMGNNFDRAISVMFSGMEGAWKPVEHEGETFMQAAVRRTGLSAETIKRHTTVQWLLESDKIPDQFRPQIESGNQNALERVANALKEGFEFTVPEWLSVSEKISEERETGKVVREITGKPARKNLLMILVDEQGRLWAWTKEEGLVEGGRIDVHSDSPAVKKMVARITGCAGIKPKEEF